MAIVDIADITDKELLSVYKEKKNIFNYKVIQWMTERVSQENEWNRIEDRKGKLTLENVPINYCISVFLVAALTNNVELLHICKDSRLDFFNCIKNEFIEIGYTIDKKDYIHAIWGYVLWRKDNSVRRELIKIIEDNYEQASDEKRVEISIFLMDTIQKLHILEDMESAIVNMREIFPKIYQDNKVEICKNMVMYNYDRIIPYSIVFDYCCEVYQRSNGTENGFVDKRNVYALIYSTFAWGVHIVMMQDLFYPEWDNPISLDEWIEHLWENDAYIEERQKQIIKWKKDEAELKKKQFLAFVTWMQRVKGVISESDYLSFINVIWENMAAFLNEGDSNEGKINKYIDACISYLKKEIKGLQEEGINVRKLFLQRDFNYHDDVYEQFLFYKYEIQPKQDMVLGARELEKLGVPQRSIENINGVNDIFSHWREEKNCTIKNIWRESKIQFRMENHLYNIQKKLIEECPKEELIQAIKCGFFPKKIRKKMLDFAMNEGKTYEVLPILISMTGGGSYE